MVTKPISLRLNRDEVSQRAYRVLARLEQDSAVQRVVKLKAAKVTLALYAMNEAAAPKLRTMPRSLREEWLTNYKKVLAIVENISRRGV